MTPDNSPAVSTPGSVIATGNFRPVGTLNCDATNDQRLTIKQDRPTLSEIEALFFEGWNSLISEDPVPSFQKQNATGASHPGRIARGFLFLPWSPLGGGMTALARQPSQRSAAFAKASCRRVISRSPSRNRCGGQRSAPVRRTGVGGGRNARATRPRSRALPECPPEIHPRESPAAAGSAAIIQQAQERSRFRCGKLSTRPPPLRNRKTVPACAEVVDADTSLWKTVEN